MPLAARRLAIVPLLFVLLAALIPAAPALAAPHASCCLTQAAPSALSASSAPSADPLSADLTAALEAVRAEARTAGALLYVAVPGRDAYVGAAGLADVAAGTPLETGARVRVASVTKTFVAVVALQLVQEGWLLLDHNVEHWLPGLMPGGEQITVRQLLAHRSGLADYLTDGIVAQARREPERVWTPAELVAEALRKPRRFAPGAPGRWAYSNTNYILLGMIVERVTGNPLERELRQRIVEPLGLTGTALAPPTASTEGLARGYVRGKDYTALNMSVAWAAGGLVSTAGDLGRFAEALMNGALLRPETLAAMLDCSGTGGAWGIPDLAYGLGVMRRTLPAAGLDPTQRLALGHTGALGGYRSAVWHFPHSGVTIVALLTSYEADPEHLVSRALEALAANGAL